MPSRRSCSVALVLALAAAPARAVAVASGGDPIAAAADAAAKDVLASNQVPGVAVGVSVGGRTVFVRGYGFADAAKKTPVTAETRFEIGSITKQITAACVMQLVEARKLSLDDHLGTFVSDYFIGRGVTVRQLLDQQSGIPDFSRETTRSRPRERGRPRTRRCSRACRRSRSSSCPVRNGTTATRTICCSVA